MELGHLLTRPGVQVAQLCSGPATHSGEILTTGRSHGKKPDRFSSRIYDIQIKEDKKSHKPAVEWIPLGRKKERNEEDGGKLWYDKWRLSFVDIVRCKWYKNRDFNLLTYLLTYSMVQSPSWAADWLAASQEIPRISRKPKVHYRTHKRTPPVPILGQPNPVHMPTWDTTNRKQTNKQTRL